MRKVELVLDIRAELGEGPRWQAREGVLYFIDIARQQLHRYDPASGALRSRAFDEPVGCFAFRPGGGFALAMRHGFGLIDDFDGPVRPIGPRVDEHREEIRFNDGRVDPQGRFWAGTVNMTKSAPDATVYRLTPAGEIAPMAGGMLTCNGTAFSPDGRTLYYSDTPRHVIYAADLDPASGDISNPRVFHLFPEGHGRPDGASVDADGCYWSALYDGARVARLSPAGEVLEEVPIPAQRPTMIAFGGADRRTAYVTTAREKLGAAALAEHPLSGGVFSFRVEVPGLPETDFPA